MGRFVDINGQRFGHIVAQGYDVTTQKWVCICDCGNPCAKKAGHLNSGYAKSCGCSLRYDNLGTHRRSLTSEYKAWSNARSRCYRQKDKKYPLYGARGIIMCERWRESFAAFYEDMGAKPKGHSLDRIDSNGDYEPSNCRWADYITQNRNRPGYNRYVVCGGRRVTVGEAAELTGIPHATILSRLDSGRMEVEACLGR